VASKSVREAVVLSFAGDVLGAVRRTRATASGETAVAVFKAIKIIYVHRSFSLFDTSFDISFP
jgi:hypothetical protein